MKSYVILIILVIGIALGVAIALYGPDYMDTIIPKATNSAKKGIEGEVIAKRLEQDRLLITLDAAEGAILVTFRKKIPEIDLLVEKGDTMRLNIRQYKPFVDDPDISMLKKPEREKVEPEQPEPTEMIKPKAEEKRGEMGAEEKEPAEERATPILNSAPQDSKKSDE